jgi:hypothetical protein
MTALRPMFGTGTTNGNMAAVTGTGTGTSVTLHTAVAGTDHIDEVYVYACNIHTANVTLTMEIDGTAAANQVKYVLPYNDGFHLVLPGIRMENAGTVKAFAGTADVINCIVIVNRYIDPETAS